MEVHLGTIAKNQWVILNKDAVPSFNPEWFDQGYWKREERIVGANSGRGSAWTVRSDYGEWVLRHYFRGGFAAKLGKDRYLWTGLEKTRAFREFRLLAQMREQGLAVPNPVAARVVKSGLAYRCDLIMECISHEMTFSKWLNSPGLDRGEQWAKVGESVARFHSCNIYHADLNTHNILIAKDKVYVIDFDRGAVMSSGGVWQRQNLDRLRRSVEKVTGKSCDAELTDGWQMLEAAYAAGLA